MKEYVSVPAVVFSAKIDPRNPKGDNLWVRIPVDKVSPSGTTFVAEGKTWNTPKYGICANARGESSSFSRGSSIYLEARYGHSFNRDKEPENPTISLEEYKNIKTEVERTRKEKEDAIPFDVWLTSNLRHYGSNGAGERLLRETPEDQIKYIDWMVRMLGRAKDYAVDRGKEMDYKAEQATRDAASYGRAKAESIFQPIDVLKNADW